ncbi:amino acid permease [Nemorincola caseinilytica]|uniref:Amino acid permease n=1 Tax=Nemorincola caseinilytica TaxID=2054315 RepID=A0ABP8N6H5_9BACT
MSIKPLLSRFDLTMIVVSLVIGMGIFRTPADVAIKAGSEWVFYGAWIFGGVVSLCGALTFAEIGARYPHAGGFYKTLSHCYHPSVAFMAEWVLAISNIASVAAVAMIGAGYINPVLMPDSLQNDTGIKITTITSVLVLYVVNYLGIKTSARLQNALTLFKIGMIILLCMAVFVHDAPPPVATYKPYEGSLISAFGLSLIPVFFTYTGYALTINMGGDIAQPQRNIPRSIFTGIGIVLALYLAANFAYCRVLGFGGVQQTDVLAARMAQVLFGSVGYKVTSILMFLSVLAYVNVYIMSNPRVYYAMAEDGVLPPIFRRVNPRTQVQEFGITVFVAAILVTLFFADSFGSLLNYTMFFNTTGLILGASAIFVLRKRDDGQEGIYKVRPYPIVPLIFIAAYAYVTICIVADDPAASYVYGAAFAIGLAIYYLCIRIWGNKPQS